MNDVTLSVIIPMYNGEDYINRLFNMIQPQMTEDIEVVFVDDGSTDRTVEIVDRLITETAGKIAGSMVLVKQENSGCSAARNNGLQNCKGKYITFIDSDDAISDNYLSTFTELIERNPDYDMWFTGVSTYNELGELYETKRNEYKILDSREKIITALVHDEIAVPYSMWSKIIRKEFINSNNIQFYDDAKCMSDGLFYSQCFEYVDKAVLSDYVGYEWRRREGSITATYYENTPELVVRYMDNIKKMYNSIPELKEDKKAEEWLLKKEKFLMEYPLSRIANGGVTGATKKIAIKKMLSMCVSQRVIDAYYAGIEKFIFTGAKKNNSYFLYEILVKYEKLKKFCERARNAVIRRL